MGNIDKLLYCFMAKVKDSTMYEDYTVDCTQIEDLDNLYLIPTMF